MHVCKLVLGELVLVRLDLGLLKIPEESELVLQEEKQGSSLAVSSTRSTANSVNVIFRVIGRVILHDPINLREVKPTLSDICA